MSNVVAIRRGFQKELPAGLHPPNKNGTVITAAALVVIVVVIATVATHLLNLINICDDYYDSSNHLMQGLILRFYDPQGGQVIRSVMQCREARSDTARGEAPCWVEECKQRQVAQTEDSFNRCSWCHRSCKLVL